MGRQIFPRCQRTAAPRCIILLRKLASGGPSPLKYLTTIHPVAASYAVSSATRVQRSRNAENRISVASSRCQPLEQRLFTKCTVLYDTPATARLSQCLPQCNHGRGWGRNGGSVVGTPVAVRCGRGVHLGSLAPRCKGPVRAKCVETHM